MIWNTKLSVKFIRKTEPTAKDPEICLRKISNTKRETQNGKKQFAGLREIRVDQGRKHRDFSNKYLQIK